MDRRKFITNTSLLAIGSSILTSKADAAPQAKKDDLQVAFLSDVHVKPTAAAEAGMRKAFRHVNSLKQKPDFIINGGDAIMDAMASNKAKTQAQWDVWNKVLNSENHLPVYHVIGKFNRDSSKWKCRFNSS